MSAALWTRSHREEDGPLVAFVGTFEGEGVGQSLVLAELRRLAVAEGVQLLEDRVEYSVDGREQGTTYLVVKGTAEYVEPDEKG